MSLGELRLRAQQRADRVSSNFVTLPEWNFFINQAMYELYDILIDCYEDYFEAPEIIFYSNGSDYFYPLPDGVLSFSVESRAGSAEANGDSNPASRVVGDRGPDQYSEK